MVSDWLKTQKKPPTPNQIRAVITTKFKKMAIVFSKQRFDFVCKTTIETLKKTYSKNPNSKKYVFLSKCIEKKKNNVNKVEKNEPEKLNKLLITDYTKVKNKEQKRR